MEPSTNPCLTAFLAHWEVAKQLLPAGLTQAELDTHKLIGFVHYSAGFQYRAPATVRQIPPPKIETAKPPCNCPEKTPAEIPKA